jgi:glycine amidinotransferase
LIDGGEHAKGFVINDNRPAFDAADFIRVGKNTMIGQLSNVTNPSGVQHVRNCLKGTGIELYILDTTDPHAMHIDATAMPLKEGLMVYHPDRISVEKLREVPALKDWTFVKKPEGQTRDYPPFYMTSNSINMNVVSLDGHHVFIESDDQGMADLLVEHGMVPVRLPFKNVNCLGGSFHCATVDVRRSPRSSIRTTMFSAPTATPFTHLVRFVKDALCVSGEGKVRLEDNTPEMSER